MSLCSGFQSPAGAVSTIIEVTAGYSVLKQRLSYARFAPLINVHFQGCPTLSVCQGRAAAAAGSRVCWSLCQMFALKRLPAWHRVAVLELS